MREIRRRRRCHWRAPRQAIRVGICIRQPLRSRRRSRLSVGSSPCRPVAAAATSSVSLLAIAKITHRRRSQQASKRQSLPGRSSSFSFSFSSPERELELRQERPNGSMIDSLVSPSHTHSSRQTFGGGHHKSAAADVAAEDEQEDERLPSGRPLREPESPCGFAALSAD